MDGLILNEEEAVSLLPGETHRLPEALRRLSDTVVLTRGAAGALAVTSDCFVETNATAVSRVVDSTGAGDAFAGGFLSAWLSGMDLEKSCKLGHRFAGRVVGRVGGR